MCTAPKPPAYKPPPPPEQPSIPELAAQQVGNVLTSFANQEKNQFGLQSYNAAKAAGLTDLQIKNLLPTSGIGSLGEKAASALGLTAGPILNPTQQMEAQYKAQMDKQYEVAQKQYEEQTKLQQSQYEQSMQAQEKALQAQLAQQDALAKRSEEVALRSQVPQLTSNSANATRVRSSSSSRASARSAAQGTSQLRVPLGISASSGSTSGLTNTSPIKLNIG